MSNTFFSEYSSVYEIMWNNMVQPDRPRMTIQCDACAVHAFAQQQWLRGRV
jgi:hypothetical protein